MKHNAKDYQKVVQSNNPHYASNNIPSAIGDSSFSFAEYLSAIPDQKIRSTISQIAKIKIQELHKLLDFYTKAFWSITHNHSQFLSKLTNLLNKDSSLITSFKTQFSSSTSADIQFLEDYLKFNHLTPQNYNLKREVYFEAEFSGSSKPLAKQLDEIRDLADYQHHVVMRKLAVKSFEPAPIVQSMKKVSKIVNFDKLHKDAVNCVDICPFGKLLITASSDGTIKCIDLETMTQIREVTVSDNHQKKLKSVCIDDNHNIAYVNEDNVLRIYSIEQGVVIAEYKGENLMELTDIIPNQACQYTSDYNYLAFRSSSTKITLFDMVSKGIVKEYFCDDKINDFSISSQKDYIALAIYSECSTEILSLATGEKVCEMKVESK